MCPECLSRNWTQTDDNRFICDECGATHITFEMIAGSDFYVYRFVNDDWGIPFYVGKGTGNRYKTLSGRSNHIQAICSNSKWHAEIIKHCESEAKAYEFEKAIKKEYKELGYPIIDGETSLVHKERQREGIENAKIAGKYKGRKAIEIPDNFDEWYDRYLVHQISKVDMAKFFNVSRPTLDKWIATKQS